MNQERLSGYLSFLLVLFTGLWLCVPIALAKSPQDSNPASTMQGGTSWKSPAKLHRWIGGEKGYIIISSDGIEFHPRNGRALKWSLLDIQTFSISSRSLDIQTYQNRKKHIPGMQRYKFNLNQSVPPEIASELAREVRHPSQNEVPDRAAQSSFILPAHRRTLTGGTNGTLRFRDSGIDYVSETAGDSRSWRWDDLQTLSSSNPYRLFVFGYRDTYTFDLKKQLPRSLLNHASDEIWAHSKSEIKENPVFLPAGTSTNSSERRSEGR